MTANAALPESADGLRAMATVRDAMHDARLPRLEARMLVAHALGHARPAHAYAWLLARDRELLAADVSNRFEALVTRRLAGEPIAYLIGAREFYGRDFRCSPAGLIPRPETELLIDLALARLPVGCTGRVLDVGTGTGCVAITLALERPMTRVTALDVSEPALALARSNAKALAAGNIAFLHSDWFSAVGAEAQFDLIASNPPYVAPGDPHLSEGDLRFEPPVALADAVDGLQSYRELASGAMRHLRPGAWLVVEHGYDQGDAVPQLFRDAGFVDVALHCDLAALPRVTVARRPE